MLANTATFWTTTEFHAGDVKIMPTRHIVMGELKLPESVNNLPAETSADGNRVYLFEGNRYPSITTILKETDDEAKKALSEWRNRIGHAEAAAFTAKAAARGTSWHAFCENFLLGKPTWNYLDTPEKAKQARNIATMLNEKIESVLALEGAVVSKEYGVAGRFDLAAKLRSGRKAIIDFKTGTKLKYGNRLDGYALQSTFYADAVNELVPSEKDFEEFDTLVIAQLTPTTCYWQESNIELWRRMLLERVELYNHRRAETLLLEKAKKLTW